MRDFQIQKKTPKGYSYGSLFSNFVEDDFSIMIDRSIDSDLSTEVIMTLRYLNKKDPDREITIYINSPGGSVSDGMAIFDFCQKLSNPIKTIGLGLCASMGAFLLICLGTNREAGKNCEIMIHQPLITGMPGSKATDVEIVARQLLKIREKINLHIAERSSLSEKEIEVLSESDKWMSAEEALEYGFIDSLY